jgi:hypothetical protein
MPAMPQQAIADAVCKGPQSSLEVAALLIFFSGVVLGWACAALACLDPQGIIQDPPAHHAKPWRS